MQRSSVVLPQPEGPMIASTSRSPTSTFTSWNTSSVPNSLRAPLAVIRVRDCAGASAMLVAIYRANRSSGAHCGLIPAAFTTLANS